jgi:penicillin-binding protein 1C
VSVRQSLAASLNVPAVRTLAMMDVQRFVQTLRACGLASVVETGEIYGHSLALGSADVRLIELTNAYRTLANGGRFSSVSMLPGSARTSHQAISPQAAFIVGDMLADNEARALTFGLDSPLRLPFWSAVKTGTSKDMRDNWSMGYSSDFTVGVWVGNASGAPMRDVSGVHGAAPIWHDVMRYLHTEWQGKVASQPPTQPAGVRAEQVQFVGVPEAARREVFIAGTERSRIELATPPQTQSVKSVRSAESGVATILTPKSGAIYALDPDIPKARQQLVFEQSTGNAAWQLNGKPLGNERKLPWNLVPGTHQLTLTDAAGRELDSARFEVRVPARLLVRAP